MSGSLSIRHHQVMAALLVVAILLSTQSVVSQDVSARPAANPAVDSAVAGAVSEPPAMAAGNMPPAQPVSPASTGFGDRLRAHANKMKEQLSQVGARIKQGAEAAGQRVQQGFQSMQGRVASMFTSSSR